MRRYSKETVLPPATVRLMPSIEPPATRDQCSSICARPRDVSQSPLIQAKPSILKAGLFVRFASIDGERIGISPNTTIVTPIHSVPSLMRFILNMVFIGISTFSTERSNICNLDYGFSIQCVPHPLIQRLIEYRQLQPARTDRLTSRTFNATLCLPIAIWVPGLSLLQQNLENDRRILISYLASEQLFTADAGLSLSLIHC